MRVVAITRVLNEADIIEAFVRHTAAFVSHHVLLDNGSADGTVEILRELKNEGLPLTVYQSRAITFNESDELTQLYKRACAEEKPDWILCLDADEFMDDRHIPGGLLQYLADFAGQPDAPNCIQIPMINYIATSKDAAHEQVVPLRMRQRRAPSDAYKIIIRGDLPAERVSIQHGSHFAKLAGGSLQVITEKRIGLAHYSERSPFQYVLKFVRGWSKVLASGQEELDKKTAYHYKGPFEHLRDHPANLLRSARFMSFKDETPDLIDDPINYRGTTLRYTGNNDEAMRAVRGLMGFVDEMATRHGKLMDEFPFVRAAVQDWEEACNKII